MAFILTAPENKRTKTEWLLILLNKGPFDPAVTFPRYILDIGSNFASFHTIYSIFQHIFAKMILLIVKTKISLLHLKKTLSRMTLVCILHNF